MKIHKEMSSAKWQPFCSGLKVLTDDALVYFSLQKYVCIFVYIEFIKTMRRDRKSAQPG